MSEKKPLRLTCPVCETRLKIAEDIEQFACLNCATELEVLKEGGVARLVPSEATTAEMSGAQQELVEVNTALKAADDNYGIGCAVATMGITLVACVALTLAIALQNQLLFWLTIGVALVLLAFVLFLFVAASSRSTDPLLRRRDELQAAVQQEEQAAEPATPDQTNPATGPDNPGMQASGA